MMEMFVLSFFISSSILSLDVNISFLGVRSTMSVMAHAVAYSRLLILVMLRSCPCLMLVRTRFALFRISATWLLIFSFETGFVFFKAISLVISSGVCWAALFSCLFSSSGIVSRFSGGYVGVCGGSSWAWALFAHPTLSWISWSSVGVSFCCLSIY